MLFRSVANFEKEFACLRGMRGIHLFTLADISSVPYYEAGSSMFQGLPDLMGTEWMPYEGTMYLQPGQHRVDQHPTTDFDEIAQVRWVNPLTHSSQHDVIMGYIGDQEVPTIPDIGSPYSFHDIRLRKSLKGPHKPVYVMTRRIRAKGFFDKDRKSTRLNSSHSSVSRMPSSA